MPRTCRTGSRYNLGGCYAIHKDSASTVLLIRSFQMTTAVSARPVPAPQKIKRPPPPMVQTSMNGAKSSQSSPSPSLSSKRPPPGFKQPPGTALTNGPNGTTVGAAPRSSNRRRDSQRPGDSMARPPRSARSGPGDNTHGDKKTSKRIPEPYGMLSSPLSG